MGWCSRCRRDVGMLSKHHGRNPACREAFLTEDTVAPLSLPGPLDLPLRKGIIQLDMADNLANLRYERLLRDDDVTCSTRSSHELQLPLALRSSWTCFYHREPTAAWCWNS